MSVRDRLITLYNAISYPNESCGQHESIENAIIAIENKQHEKINKGFKWFIKNKFNP